MFELSELKSMRIKLELTQKELAAKANVSQSLVAKMESGKVDPGYSSAKRIFETLSMLNKKTELTAKELMYKKIISIGSSEGLKDAIALMRQKNISQMPVIEKNKVVGYISETVLLEKLLDYDSEDLDVKSIMKEAPPIIPPDTSQGVVANLLNHFPFLLVEEKGELKGIITKADLLKVVYK